MSKSLASSRVALFRSAAPFAVGLALASIAPLANAQTHGGPNTGPGPGAAADAGNTVTEVVVTAQFREQSLQQTPIAITAVNAQMLEQRNQTDITQVAAQAPNVTLKQNGAAFGSSMVAFIRGVGQTDFNFALEPVRVA